MSKNNILPFFSSDPIALPIIQSLQKDYQLLVITRLDKPQGRNLKTAANPIAAFCDSHNIACLKIDKLDLEFIKILSTYDFSIGICFSFGLILPPELLKLFPDKLINIHPSSLPKYRGPSPIQASLLHGDQQTALTYMIMVEIMDAGPILKQFNLAIDQNDTYQSLTHKIATLGAQTIAPLLDDFNQGKIKFRPQDDNQATYCRLIDKKDGLIDWSSSAEQIFNHWRAYHIWPGIYSYWQDKKTTLQQIEIAKQNSDQLPGTVYQQDNDVLIQTGHNSLKINELQIAGKNKMPIQDFLNGHPDFINSQLTNS